MKPSNQSSPSHRDAEYLWHIKDYNARASNLYPEIPLALLHKCSLLPVDAMVIGYFLEYLDENVTVHEIGTSMGMPSYLFATHPSVTNVVCIGPNPRVADRALANSEWAGVLDVAGLGELRVFDVAQEVLASLDQHAVGKVEFREGVVGSESSGIRTERGGGVARTQIPQLATSGDHLLAYVDDVHTREGVREALVAIYESNPKAITILDECRHVGGAFVQAGVVDFIEHNDSSEMYTFRLFADLGPGVATSSLGLLYHRDRAQEVDNALRGVASKFTRRLDPMQLLIRENELIREVNRTIDLVSDEKQTNRGHRERIVALRKRNDQLQERNGQLRKRDDRHRERIADLRRRNAELEKRTNQLQRDNELLLKTLQRRSHQAAEAFATSVQRIPGIRSLIRGEQ